MALFLVGIGLNDEKDISLKALELAKKANIIYFENFTGKFNGNIKNLEKLCRKKIIIAGREKIENDIDKIINEAKTKDIAILVIGDVFSATTHINYLIEAKKKKIDIKMVHNASIFSAIAVTGLHLYKFGKTASIPFVRENFFAKSYYNILEENLKNNAHTLFLLDVDAENEKYMSFNEALELLLKVENEEKKKLISKESYVVICAKLGSDDFSILYGKVKDLLKKNLEHKKPHCLIIPAKELHFSEEDALDLWKNYV